MSDMLNFINPEDLEFYISDGMLLCLIYKGENIGRVSVKRMFPFQYSEEYIVVCKENYDRGDSENEIGIIRDIQEMTEDQVTILEKELHKRYFIPDITAVENIKEEYGNISFKVNTSAGDREFIVTDLGSNIKNVGSDRILITDVYGNRYYIPDINQVDEKTIKVLEIWI